MALARPRLLCSAFCWPHTMLRWDTCVQRKGWSRNTKFFLFGEHLGSRSWLVRGRGCKVLFPKPLSMYIHRQAA